MSNSPSRQERKGNLSFSFFRAPTFVFVLPLLALFVLTPMTASAAFGVIREWRLPADEANYAFEDDVVVTGTAQLPPLWVGNIYVYLDGTQVPSAAARGANCGARPAPTGCFIALPFNPSSDMAVNIDFSYNIGGQSDGAHEIKVEFWGGEICAVKQQLNINASLYGLPEPYPASETCPTTIENFYAAQLYDPRDFTVNRPRNPRFVVDPSTNPALSYVDVPTNSTLVRNFTISNTGLQNLGYELLGLSAPYYCNETACNGTLVPGETRNVRVRFAPEADGEYVRTLTFTCTGSPLPCNVPSITRVVRGTAVGSPRPPQLSVIIGNPVDFGTHYFGHIIPPQLVRISNSGGGVLEGSLSLPSTEYYCGGGCNYSVFAGETRDIWVYFVPDHADESRVDTGTFIDGTTIPLRSSVSDRPVLQACMQVAPGNCTTSWATGIVNIASSVSVPVYVRNIGAGSLTGTLSGLPSNGFTFVPAAAYPYTNLSYTVGWVYVGNIIFSPLSVAPVSASAVLTNVNPPGGNTVTFSLSGQGNDQPVAGFGGGREVRFGSVIVGSTVTANLLVTNTGVGSLDISIPPGAIPAQPAFACTTNCTVSIPSGETRSIAFTFSPTVATSYSTSISVAGQTVTLLGVGVQPGLQARAQNYSGTYSTLPVGVPIEYGTTYYGSPVQNRPLSLELNSIGGLNTRVVYTVDTSAAPHFTCTGSYCSNVTISQDAGFVSRRTPSIEFRPGNAPAGPGSYTETITIRYHYGDSIWRTLSYEVRAESVVSSYLSVSPASHDFLDVIVGDPSPTRVFTVRNDGSSALEVWLAPYIHDTIFECVGVCSYTGASAIPIGETRDFTFRFTPTAGQVYMTSIPFRSNANAVDRPVRGAGINTPIMKLTPAGITDPDTYAGNLNFIDMGDANLATEKLQTVRIWNVGRGLLQMSISFQNGAHFSCYPAATGCVFSVPADEYRDVTLRFLPIATGPLADIAYFRSTNAINPEILLSMSGVGIFAPIITIAGAGKDFPPTVVGRWREQDVIIRNTGTVDFGTGSISVAGVFRCVASSAGPLDASGNCPYRLDAGGSTTLTIRFSPIAPVGYHGAVSLSGLPVANFTLSGTGVPPSVQYIER